MHMMEYPVVSTDLNSTEHVWHQLVRDLPRIVPVAITRQVSGDTWWRNGTLYFSQKFPHLQPLINVMKSIKKIAVFQLFPYDNSIV